MGLLKDAFGRLFGAAPVTSGGKGPAASGVKAPSGQAGGAKSAPGKKQGARKAAVGKKNADSAARAETSGTGSPVVSAAGEKALAQVRAAQGTVVTEGRAELIRQAMTIRKAKQQILADLSDDQRARLAALAIRGLLNEGRDEPKN